MGKGLIMKTIRSITYQTDFYWKGDRYRQVIRIKRKDSKAPVWVRKLYSPYDDYIQMPLGRKVKPVIKYELL